MSEIKGVSAVGLTQMRYNTRVMKLATAIQVIMASQDLAASFTRSNETKMSGGGQNRASVEVEV